MRAFRTAIAAVCLLLHTGAAAAANPDAVAVIIGNRTYEGRVPEVAYAHRDAEAVKRFVLDILGYDAANVIDLRDATQAQMLSAFGNAENHRGKAFQYARPGESDLLVYFSGHGVPGIRDRRGYLLPVNADPATAEINGYPIDLLYDNLRKIGARSVTVLIDACFSGDSPRGMLIQSASPVFVAPKMPDGTGLTILTAASGGELASWDEDAEHGLFTEYLLRALHGEADDDRYGAADGVVTLGEVGAYLDREMTYRARRAYNRDQHATVHGEPGKVLLRYSRDARPARTALAAAEDRKDVALATPPAPAVPKLEPVDTAYVATRNANVRAEPTVASQRITTLPVGADIHVAGRTTDGEWMAVEREGRPLGYVYAPLLQEKDAWDAARREAARQEEAAARRRAEEEAHRRAQEQARLRAEEEARQRALAERQRAERAAAEARRKEQQRLAALRAEREAAETVRRNKALRVTARQTIANQIYGYFVRETDRQLQNNLAPKHYSSDFWGIKAGAVCIDWEKSTPDRIATLAWSVKHAGLIWGKTMPEIRQGALDICENGRINMRADCTCQVIYEQMDKVLKIPEAFLDRFYPITVKRR